MINVNTIAENIENGLNAAFADPNIALHVWTDVGKYEKPVRTGNSVKVTLPALLTCISSSNTTASGGLVLGLQSLLLQIRFPQRKPRTSPDEEPEEDYAFVEQMRDLLDAYFSANKTFAIEDGDTTYKVGMSYGISVSGTAELSNHLAPSYELDVNINLLYAENGVNSRDVTAQFDGVPVNFETANPARSATVSTDVYSSSDLIATNFVNSTAFSVDCTIPATTNEVTMQFVEYLLKGKANTAHFVKLTWGTAAEKVFLMTMKDIQASVSGVENVGLVLPLMEISRADMANYPEGFYVARLTLENIEEETSITLPKGMYYFNGKAFEVSEDDTVITELVKPQNLIPAGNAYETYFVSLNAILPKADTSKNTENAFSLAGFEKTDTSFYYMNRTVSDFTCELMAGNSSAPMGKNLTFTLNLYIEKTANNSDVILAARYGWNEGELYDIERFTGNGYINKQITFTAENDILYVELFNSAPPSGSISLTVGEFSVKGDTNVFYGVKNTDIAERLNLLYNQPNISTTTIVQEGNNA